MSFQQSKDAASPLLSSTALTTTNTRGGESPAQTSFAAPSGGGSSGDIPPARNGGDHVTFPKSGDVYEISDQQRQVDVPFQLADSSVLVMNLAWYVNAPPAGGDQWNLTTVMQDDGGDRAGFYQEPRSGTDRKASFNFNNIPVNDHAGFGKPMVVGVNWTASGQAGMTYSPAFSFVDSSSSGGPGSSAVENARNLLKNSPYASSVEAKFNTSTGTAGGDHGSAAAPLPTTGSSGPSGLGVGSGSGGSSSKGGLSTGAIVGIAVGVGVAALLAAALAIFFFLRRRRRRTVAQTNGANAAAAEQEKLSAFPPKDGGGSSSNAANASDAAIAPYRDDNNNTASHDRRRSSTAARGAGAADAGAATASLDSEGRARGEQAGVSRHLVEDGMTAEEIQRLEEEEAQLDAEIRRAGGGARH